MDPGDQRITLDDFSSVLHITQVSIFLICCLHCCNHWHKYNKIEFKSFQSNLEANLHTKQIMKNEEKNKNC